MSKRAETNWYTVQTILYLGRHPHPSYCVSDMHSTTFRVYGNKKDIEALESVQKFACKVCLKLWDTSYDDMLHLHIQHLCLVWKLINPRHVCVCLSVCLSVCQSVTALAASASVHTWNQRYSWVSLRLSLGFDSWVFKKTFRFALWREKSQYANNSPRAVFAHFRDQRRAEPT